MNSLEGKRILVTGAGGMLGSEFISRLRAKGVLCEGVSRPRVDLDDPASFASCVDEGSWDVVLHCAAETNVDACETDPEMASRRNHESTMAMAHAAARQGAKFVFVSSSGVFDGKQSEPYHEMAAPSPSTAYARSKVTAEETLLREVPGSLVVRAGWLFGGAASQKKNFVAARWREAQGKEELVSAGDKFGSPTWTRDLVDLVMRLVEAEAHGVIHTVNSGVASRAEYVAEIVRLFGLSTSVRAVSSAEFPRKAPVPDNEALTSVRLQEFGVAPLRSWREALEEYVREEGAGISSSA